MSARTSVAMEPTSRATPEAAQIPQPQTTTLTKATPIPTQAKEATGKTRMPRHRPTETNTVTVIMDRMGMATMEIIGKN